MMTRDDPNTHKRSQGGECLNVKPCNKSMVDPQMRFIMSSCQNLLRQSGQKARY